MAYFYEQKAANGEWIFLDDEFASKKDAREFVKTMNEACHSNTPHYRVAEVTDPVRLAEIRNVKAARLAKYDAFMEAW